MSCLFSCTSTFSVDHMPDKETRKRKAKKTFEIDFNDDVNFDTYFRTTRVRIPPGCLLPNITVEVSSGINVVHV